MPFGELPRSRESTPTTALYEAEKNLKLEAMALSLSFEEFEALSEGIPERLLRAVAALAEAAGDDGNAFRRATTEVRQWLAKMNGDYLDQYAVEPSLYTPRFQAHQEVIEELFLLLGDAGYARLLVRGLAVRDELEKASSSADRPSWSEADAPTLPPLGERSTLAIRKEIIDDVRLDSDDPAMNNLYRNAWRRPLPGPTRTDGFFRALEGDEAEDDSLDSQPPVRSSIRPIRGRESTERPAVESDASFN